MTTDIDNVSNNSRTLRLLSVDSLTLGVPEKAILAIAEWTEPTPLPFAPPTVLGIVSVHGRMITVIDLKSLLGRKSTGQSRSIIALRSNEQLGLAVDRVLDSVTVKDDEITKSESDLIEATVHLNGEEVLLLDINSLFAGAMRGRERRRRRL